MNESITRAAGAGHGEEISPREMEQIIASLGRSPRQRSTTYGEIDDERREVSFEASPLAELVNNAVRKRNRRAIL